MKTDWHLKKFLIFLIIITTLLSSVSCRAKVDIQELAIIMAMGVDKTEDGRYMVSYQVLNANSSLQGGVGVMGEGGSGGISVINFEGEGETVIDAMFRMGDKVSKKLHFGQLKVLIIGERAAEGGIAAIMDALGRFSEIRANLPIYITMEKASEVVKHRTSEDSIPANVIDNMITRQVVVGSHPVIYLAQLIDRLSSEFSIPVLGVINPPKGQEASSGANFVIDSMAIFDKDKLIGYLDSKTTLGYQYIKGKADQVTVFVKLPNGSKISLGMIKSRSTIKTQIIDDEPRAVINITQESFLREMTGEIDVVKNPKIMEEIAKLQEEVVKDTVQETIRAAKEDIKADFIGMGEAIYRQHPKEFEKMKDRWKEKFLDLQIEVYVNAKVRDTGLLTKPVY